MKLLGARWDAAVSVRQLLADQVAENDLLTCLQVKKWYVEGDVYRVGRGQVKTWSFFRIIMVCSCTPKFEPYGPRPNQEHGALNPYPNSKL